MATVQFQDPFRDFHGSTSKNGVIHRHKQFRNNRGKVISEATPEAYVVMNPRDWKKHPATGKELEGQNLFKEAAAQTAQILKAAKPDYTPAPEEIETLRYWQERFDAQLTKPESDAPIDKNTGNRKSYVRLDAYIRASIYKQLKNHKLEI